MIQIYTGDGKGKTTAAIGQAIRYLGADGRVMFIQFLKDSNSSELSIFADLDNITLMPNPWSYGFTWDMTKEEMEEAKAIYAQYLDMLLFRIQQDDYGMLVLDEAATACSLGLLDCAQLLDLIDQLPDDMEIVLTGRDAPEQLIDRADYVTEMKKIKHPFDKGQRARKGIEY